MPGKYAYFEQINMLPIIGMPTIACHIPEVCKP